MVPLFKPYMPEGIEEGIKEILYSGQLAFGKWGKAFESELKEYLKTENLLVVSSHASAVNVAFTTLGVGYGDEVVMSPMCCLQSTQPLLALGVKIIWADINPQTGTLCPDSVRNKITPKTKAIFHNHHLGYVGYVDEINQIAREKGVYVIDDCIDGLGGTYKGNKVGNVGSDATVISFSAVRLPNAIDGGAVTFRDENHLSLARKKRDLGIDRSFFRTERGEINPQFDINTVGYAAMLSDVNAYVAYQQMKDLDTLFAKAQDNAKQWETYVDKEKLKCKPIEKIAETTPNYWVFGLLSEDRNRDIDFFKEKGFYASQVHLNNNIYSIFGKKEELKGVNEFYNKFLAIPCGWWVENILSDEI